MKKALLFVCMLAGASAQAGPIDIITINGQVVQVSEEALKRAYEQLVTTMSNQVSTMEDGSTAIRTPSLAIAGLQHTVAAYISQNLDFGTGLCKLRGLQKATAGEIDWNIPNAPTVVLDTKGQVLQTFPAGDSRVRAFKLLICR